MKKISHLAVFFLLFASFGTPMLVSAAGSIPVGGDCTSNSSGCATGLYCVPGDRGSVCSFSSSGYVPAGTAQSPSSGGINLNAIEPYSKGIINLINNVLVPVLMAIAFIVFLWGVFKYFIYGADSETERATGKQFVLWGVIGFVIILAVWGLVRILASVFSLSLGGSAPTPPTF